MMNLKARITALEKNGGTDYSEERKGFRDWWRRADELLVILGGTPRPPATDEEIDQYFYRHKDKILGNDDDHKIPDEAALKILKIIDPRGAEKLERELKANKGNSKHGG